MWTYHSDKIFVLQFTVTLTFDLMTSISIGFVYSSSRTSKSRLNTIGLGIVKLSLRQASVYRRTDQPTDRTDQPTDRTDLPIDIPTNSHVLSNIPLLFEGGIFTPFLKYIICDMSMLCTNINILTQCLHQMKNVKDVRNRWAVKYLLDLPSCNLQL